MGASPQAKLGRGKIIQLATTAIVGAPTDGTTAPHWRMGPKAPTGLQTTGFFMGLKAPSSGSATAGAGGFTVAVWILNTVTLAWFSFSSQSVSYNQAFVTFDIDAAGLYFQVTNVSVDGNINFHVWEQ